MLPELGHERLREITLPRLQRSVDRLAGDGIAPATITATITPLRAIYRGARQLGEVQTNPAGRSRHGQSGTVQPGTSAATATLR